MTTKTYRRYKYNNPLTIKVNGVKRVINFKPTSKDMYDFVTSEADVQEALEKQTGYKHVFYLVSTVIKEDQQIEENNIIANDTDKDLVVTFNDIAGDINDKDTYEIPAVADAPEEENKPIIAPKKAKKAKKQKRKSK